LAGFEVTPEGPYTRFVLMAVLLSLFVGAAQAPATGNQDLVIANTWATTY